MSEIDAEDTLTQCIGKDLQWALQRRPNGSGNNMSLGQLVSNAMAALDADGFEIVRKRDLCADPLK
jgi:hypothetical protein